MSFSLKEIFKKLLREFEFDNNFTRGADSTFNRISQQGVKGQEKKKRLEDPNEKDLDWDDSDEPDVDKNIDIYTDTLNDIEDEDEES